MATTLIAVEGCTITDINHGGTCVIKSGLSTYETINGKKVCLDGLVVTVSGGTIPGPQVAPVDVTINAQIIQFSPFGGKCPLAVNEVSGGTEIGEYTVGQSTVPAPIVLQITDAGQQFVKAQ